jgi:hypothetical protein
VKVRHYLGIITNVSKKSVDQATATTHFHTVLTRRSTNLHPKSSWVVIPIMNLSTFLREWTALHSVTNATLLPLAPYLMNGSPVCSPLLVK